MLDDFLGNSCSSGQTCKSFAQCAAQTTSGDIQSCDLNGNGLGICCKDITSNIGKFIRFLLINYFAVK